MLLLLFYSYKTKMIHWYCLKYWSVFMCFIRVLYLFIWLISYCDHDYYALSGFCLSDFFKKRFSYRRRVTKRLIWPTSWRCYSRSWSRRRPLIRQPGLCWLTRARSKWPSRAQSRSPWRVNLAPNLFLSSLLLSAHAALCTASSCSSSSDTLDHVENAFV